MKNNNMKKSWLLTAFCMLLLMAACGHKVSRQELLDEIDTRELSLDYYSYNADSIAAAQNEMIGLYRKFYTSFPTDSMAAVYMVRSADLLVSLERTDEALGLLDSIISQHPEYGDIGGCWFLKGLAYENAGKYDQAREAYTYFVDNYPDHYLAETTRSAMQYLGMSSEEMFDAIMNAANDQGFAL